MQKYLNKLSFKIGALIIVTEIISLSILGFFYINKFTGEIEKKVEKQMKIPGIMMSQGVLRYESAENRITMENIVGETISECFIIGADGKVYYSLEPEFRGKMRNDVKALSLYDELNKEISEPVFKKVVKDDSLSYVGISPLRLEEGKFLGIL